jgi:hypothetical protein
MRGVGSLQGARIVSEFSRFFGVIIGWSSFIPPGTSRRRPRPQSRPRAYSLLTTTAGDGLGRVGALGVSPEVGRVSDHRAAVRRLQIAHPVADHTRLPGWGSVTPAKGSSTI